MSAPTFHPHLFSENLLPFFSANASCFVWIFSLGYETFLEILPDLDRIIFFTFFKHHHHPRQMNNFFYFSQFHTNTDCSSWLEMEFYTAFNNVLYVEKPRRYTKLRYFYWIRLRDQLSVVIKQVLYCKTTFWRLYTIFFSFGLIIPMVYNNFFYIKRVTKSQGFITAPLWVRRWQKAHDSGAQRLNSLYATVSLIFQCTLNSVMHFKACCYPHISHFAK